MKPARLIPTIRTDHGPDLKRIEHAVRTVPLIGKNRQDDQSDEHELDNRSDVGFADRRHDRMQRLLPMQQHGGPAAHNNAKRHLIERNGDARQIHHQRGCLRGQPRLQHFVGGFQHAADDQHRRHCNQSGANQPDVALGGELSDQCSQ